MFLVCQGSTSGKKSRQEKENLQFFISSKSLLIIFTTNSLLKYAILINGDLGL